MPKGNNVLKPTLPKFAKGERPQVTTLTDTKDKTALIVYGTIFGWFLFISRIAHYVLTLYNR